ncbi:unnamed protein product [Ixodes hexagonus]
MAELTAFKQRSEQRLLITRFLFLGAGNSNRQQIQTRSNTSRPQSETIVNTPLFMPRKSSITPARALQTFALPTDKRRRERERKKEREVDVQ